MITIQQSENSQNQKHHTDRNFDMRTDLTQTLTLKFISETNQPQQIKIEDLNESLSREIPYFDLINHYFNIFTLDWHTRYLISYQNIKKQKNFNEEQLGIGGNGQVFLCKDLGTLELHALKFVKDISFDIMHSILNEFINQYHLMSFNKELILNFVNQISIRVVNSKVDFQIPLELAEFSLYDYIQTNEISEEIYQQLTNILIDFLILLHTNNYAHRDIKPQNILYVKDAGWKLADFGESIYYEVRQGMYNIKGTLAFISQEVRKHQKLNRQIFQDLFKNDVYAAVCTLVMIKNPQFKSKDLQQFMQENQLDTICQILINITQVEQLNQFKQEKLSKFQYLGKFINRKDELVYYDVKLIIQLQSRYRKTLDSCTIQIIDAELGKLKDNNRKVDYIRVVLQLVQYYPFLIDKFINIIEFDHNDILKNPQLYFSNTLEHCQYFFGRGLHKKLIELQNQIQNDCLESMIMKLYSLILYGQLEEAKHTLNLIANKIYQESSQVNSLFLSFYNQQYYLFW